MTDPRMDHYVRDFCEAWERLTAEQKSRLWDVDFKAYWAAIKLTAYRSALDDMQRLEKSRTRSKVKRLTDRSVHAHEMGMMRDRIDQLSPLVKEADAEIERLTSDLRESEDDLAEAVELISEWQARAERAEAQVAAALRFAEDLIEAAHDLRGDYDESLEGQAREYEGMARTLRKNIREAVTRK